MATVTATKPTPAGAVSAFAATTPAGDVVPYQGGDLLLEFINGHTSAVTVTLAPTKTTANVSGVGPVTVPTRSLELDQDEYGTFLIKADEIGSYLNSSRQVPVTYTSGNVACLIRAYAVV